MLLSAFIIVPILCATIILVIFLIKYLNIFKYIRNNGNIGDEEMLRTFNCGVGFNVVVSQKDKDVVMKHINRFYDCYEIGEVEKGDMKVSFENRMSWL